MKLSAVKPYLRLMRLDKPIGFYLLVWPTLWSLWIAAQGVPSLKLLFIFIAGTCLMRSAGCVINDFMDKPYDRYVKRTKDRPITKGIISRKQAFTLFVFLCLAAFILVLMTNILTITLAVMALPLVMIYPLMKRITHLPQLILGITFAFGIPMAFAAQTHTIPWIAWLLFVICIAWVISYDTFYAMVDREDDLKIGVKSTAILLGHKDLLFIAILQLSVLALFIFLAFYLNFHWTFYVFLGLGAGCFVYQQYLARHRIPANCFKAFLNNHWFGLYVFAGIVAHYGLA